MWKDNVGGRRTWWPVSKTDNKSFTDLSWTKFGTLPLRSSKARLKQNEAYANNDIGPAGKHLDIAKWLKSMDLERYVENFGKFNGVEDCLELSEGDIRDLGVKKSSDRATIISNLTILRAKYHGNFRRQPSMRHSVAVDSRNKIQNDDTISDLKIVSDAIQSKSLSNLKMEPTADPSLNVHELKKALEWELSLDSRDLRSHAWYHGAIPRARAEDIVRDDGSFLVRDCTSQPGNYVLTCRTKGQPLHFVINKLVLQPDTVYEHVKYQFEDDAFDTVPDLITFYVGASKPITIASGARIQTPKNRMYPLSFYAARYPTPLPARLASPTGGGRKDAPRLPSKKHRSQSLTPAEVGRISEKCNSADGVIQSPAVMTRSAGAEPLRFSTHSLPRFGHQRLALSPSAGTLGRNGLSPCAERRLFDEEGSSPPPPKPSRVPSILRVDSKEANCLQRLASYHASGSDSGNGSGDSALSSAAGDGGDGSGGTTRAAGVIIKNPRYGTMPASESSTTLKNVECCVDYTEMEERVMAAIAETAEIETTTRFDLENFQTLLLPVVENKPLDAQALGGVKMILQESGSRVLANHLTKTDLDVVYGRNEDGIVSRLNGMEVCVLPQGHQFRLDLIERTECLKLLVAVTILTCNDETERTETLNKWIEIAIDTKTALGNLFGFCGIMLGLCLPQIERLDTTWHMLRQKYTDSAFNFEAKLRPTLKNMNSCSNPQAPNTTIPHLLPFVLIIERGLDDFLGQNELAPLATSCLGLWETNAQDFGLGTLLNHLESARKYMDSVPAYRRNAEIVLGEARLDELTTDLFRTEFQLKFLWGSRGAYAAPIERHAKFEQVLNVLASKYCNIREENEA